MFGIDFDPESIFGGILQAARSLFYWISELIYSIIPDLYYLFLDIANARFLSNEVFGEIVKKVGFLLGLIALLIVIFDLIQLLLDPEKMFDKEKGMFAIVKKVIFVLIALGISSFVFNAMYWFQGYVLNNDILFKLILPAEDYEVDPELFGGVLAARTFTSFYTVNKDLLGNGDNPNPVAYDCQQYFNLLTSRIVYDNDFSAGNYCINKYESADAIGDVTVDDNESQTSNSDDGAEKMVWVMNYNFILQLIVGVMIVYLFVNYVIKIGIRAVYLSVLQILSPLFIIGYLSPKKENLFTKWWKAYFTTYIDVFVRCAIIYLVVYLSSLIMDNFASGTGEFWNSVTVHDSNQSLIMITMILALLFFAKKAPDLLKDLIPNTSKLGYGFNSKDLPGFNKGLKMGSGMVGGALGGAAIGLIGGGLGGFAGGLLKGGASGLKGQGFAKSASGAWKSQLKANKAFADAKANGASWWGYQTSHMKQNLGLRTAADDYDLIKKDLEKENSIYNQFAGYFDSAKKRAEGKILDGKYKGNAEGAKAAAIALQARDRIEILKAQAGNLDRNDENYADKLKEIEYDIQFQQATYNKNLDIAVEHFVNTSGDAVVEQNIKMAQGVLDNNSNLAGFAGASVDNYSSFEGSSGKARTQIATNTAEISRNEQEGKRARANTGK